VGLAAVAATHPLAGNNQFLSRTGLPRLWIYLGTTGKTYRVVLSDNPKITSGHLDYTKKAEPFLTLPPDSQPNLKD
jgi:hypothetical protein